MLCAFLAAGKLKFSVVCLFHLRLSLFDGLLPSRLLNNTLLLVIFTLIICAILFWCLHKDRSYTVRNNQPQHSMNQFPQLTGEQPSDITRQVKLNFLFAVLFFSQLHGLGRKYYLHTACFCTVNQFFHFQAHVLVSYLMLVYFLVGRYCENEPVLNF